MYMNKIVSLSRTRFINPNNILNLFRKCSTNVTPPIKAINGSYAHLAGDHIKEPFVYDNSSGAFTEGNFCNIY